MSVGSALKSFHPIKTLWQWQWFSLPGTLSMCVFPVSHQIMTTCLIKYWSLLVLLHLMNTIVGMDLGSVEPRSKLLGLCHFPWAVPEWNGWTDLWIFILWNPNSTSGVAADPVHWAEVKSVHAGQWRGPSPVLHPLGTWLKAKRCVFRGQTASKSLISGYYNYNINITILIL